jgi:hypothetical protein
LKWRVEGIHSEKSRKRQISSASSGQRVSRVVAAVMSGLVINQSTNQPINQSTNQPINQSINQSRPNNSQASYRTTIRTKAKQEQGGQKK